VTAGPPFPVWLIAALARLTTYFVVDTFSHLISGFHVGLENPSFFAAGLALENTTVDKVAYCAQFGIEITAEEWPSIGLTESILADRGDSKGTAHRTSFIRWGFAYRTPVSIAPT
jgi:hypothetical protein